MRKIYLVLISVFLCSFSVSQLKAQQDLTLHSFRDLPQSNYSNPAFSPRFKISLGVPLLSNASVLYSHKGFAYSDLVKSSASGDSLTVDIEKALSKNKNRAFMTQETSLDFLNFGFNFREYYIGFNITERNSARLNYTSDLIRFLWYGNSAFIGEVPDLHGALSASRYREMGIKLSYDQEFVAYGVRIKLLSGLMNVKLDGGSMFEMSTDSNSYAGYVQSDFIIHTSGLSDNLAPGSGSNLFSFTNTGIGFDAGFDYHVANNKIFIAASVRDIGSIKWKSDVKNYASQKKLSPAVVNFENTDLKDSALFKPALDSITSFLQLDTTAESYTTSLVPKFYTSILFKSTPSSTFGVLIYSEFFDTKYHPALNLNYSKKVFKNFEGTVSYSIINGKMWNFGGGIRYKRNKLQLYVVTDNLISLARGAVKKIVVKQNEASLYVPPNAKIYSIQAGINFSIDQPVMFSKPSVPD